MELHHVRAGRGEPLLLIHGLGGSWRSWRPILPALAHGRELWLVDLPGHGATPALPGRATFAALTDAVEAFVRGRGLEHVDALGSSMGARMVLELARRDVVGRTWALDPGGFWEGWERAWFGATIGLSIRILRAIEPGLRTITKSALGRTLLFGQFSHHPWRLAPDLVYDELDDYVATTGFDDLVDDLARGPGQQGARRTRGAITLVWGRQDRVSLPRQAYRAIERFPTARLVWVDGCGHLPHWDAPRRTERLILVPRAARRVVRRAPALAHAP